ncbi:hypothetical protein [Streptomyces rectiverticillatus]|uniref:hypothetical protein n=1 Tax=Streptomyces rectiverticillatus TaxID=173860 RepID=UPI003CCCB2DA
MRTTVRILAAWERAVDPGLPLAEELGRLVGESLTGDRRRLELEYELYLAALRRPAVRPIAAECVDEMLAVRAPAAVTGGPAR